MSNAFAGEGLSASPALHVVETSRRASKTADDGLAPPDALVAAYHYLCRRGARKFWRTGLEHSDLEQVAAIGLIKASRRYDAAARTPFEAYAWMMIVGELMHHVRDHERAIRLPRRLQTLERSFRRAHDALVGRLGREPSDAEFALELDVAVDLVGELRRARSSASPLPIEEAEARACSAETTLALEDRAVVDDAFGRLTEVERRIVAGVYLLGLTQLEVGRRIGLSPKRVSRLHHGALARMQRAWTAHA